MPSLFGPGIAALIEDHFGWRTVFAVGGFAALPVVPALLPAARSAARRTHTAQPDASGAGRLGRTLAASIAAAIGVTTVSLAGPEFHGTGLHRLGMTVVLIVGFAAMLMAAPTLLPAGTLRARCGASTVIALRGLVAAAFGLVGAFLPLILQTTRGLSPAASGLTLGVTGLFWAVGSNVSSRDWAQRRFSDSRRTRISLAFIVIGGFGVLVFVAGHGSYAFALALWAVAGTGMGLTSNSLSTALLQLSPPEAVGRHQSPASTTGVVAQGLSAAAGGAAIALTASGQGAFVGIVAAGIVLALIAFVLVPRMDRDCVAVG